MRMNTLLGKLNFENPSDVNEALMGAIDEMAFDDEGEHKDDMIATPSKKACRFCEFKGTKYCDYGI